MQHNLSEVLDKTQTHTMMWLGCFHAGCLVAEVSVLGPSVSAGSWALQIALIQ